MSVTTIVAVVKDAAWVYPQLPKGVFPYIAQGRVTGDGTAGQLSVSFEFNTQQLVTFQEYVTVCHFSVSSAVAALTGDCQLRAENGDWERTPITPLVAIVISPEVTNVAATTMGAAANEVTGLGRIEQGTDGSLIAETINIDGAVVDFTIKGFMADFPLIALNDWRF